MVACARGLGGAVCVQGEYIQAGPYQNFSSSKAWVYGHIQLTPEEAAEYKDCPVVYNGEYGFFFEPNE